MITIERVAPEEMLRRHQEWNAKYPPPEPPEIRNTEQLLQLTDPSRFAFGGRVYVVPPVSFPDGIRLQRIGRRVEELAKAPETDATLDELSELGETFARLAVTLVHPEQRLQRWLWLVGLRRNPFRAATFVDVGRLLAVFATCRTTSSVRHPSLPAVSAPRRSTS